MAPRADRQLRPLVGRIVRSVAARAGYDLTRRDPSSAAAPPAAGELMIPVGRTQPFSVDGYDICPRGAFDLVRHDYYSPVPDLARVPEEVWTRESALGGVDLSADAAIEFVETKLAGWVAELDVPVDDPAVPGTFHLANQGFETVDAELLYAMIRAHRPRRVIELGSGWSTLLINLASRRNAKEGVDTVHEVFDPYPRPHILGERLPAPSVLTSQSATDVALETFAALGENDILFVDTTHTVKLASDVNFVILDVLPVLAPGVIVHFHDIFLPWEYPRRWFSEMGWYWAEQYLLQAFLAYNDSWEILVPAHALARRHPTRLAQAIPSFSPPAAPASIWLRRR